MTTNESTNGYLVGSKLERMLKAGHFAVTGELGPPQSADGDEIREKAALLKGYVDGVNLTDNQTAIVRISSIAAGTILVQEGLEPVIQMTARDRNRLAIQADLLGAYALGMRNLLCLTGDHQIFGNHPTAKHVFDIDSIQMVKMVTDMRDEKKFQCGDEFKGIEPRFFTGAASAPFADPIDFRPYRLAKKVNAGANFIQTQLVYDVDAFAQFMEKVREMGLHEKVYILAGVGPLKSPGMARYMKKNVPGILVPDEIIDRMNEAGKPWAGKKSSEMTKEEKRARSKARREEGIQICIDLIQQLREIEGVAGVHVMAIEWEEAVKPIVEGAGLYPRPSV
ncbi:MAG: Bifunctional homocysteine S-methyltransferase/5,10-methylenetetrahydrofolate reductase [Chloroflexi bacterium]|nr:Bifunctional homocysteine S-methyltransferase/5,10-methylenetetrahydrofolate reductase [Chloroflexota bacterium]